MNNELITAQDGTQVTLTNFRAKQKCTPTLAGCKLCVGGEVRNGVLFVILTLETPIGNADFEFEAGSGFSRSFTFRDIVTIHISVSDIRETGAGFSFMAKAKICVRVPIIGEKCTPEFSHRIEVPFAGLSASASSVGNEELPYLVYAEYQNGQCNCH